MSKALGEYIPKLLFSINLQKLNTPFMNLLSKPNSLDRVILTSRLFKGGDTNSDDGDSVQATMTMLYYDEGR